MTLGEKLRFYRTAEGYTQALIARLLRVERSTYAYYETGKTVPDLYSVYVLSKLYGVSMELLADDREMPAGGMEFCAAEQKKKSRLRRGCIK